MAEAGLKQRDARNCDTTPWIGNTHGYYGQIMRINLLISQNKIVDFVLQKTLVSTGNKILMCPE